VGSCGRSRFSTSVVRPGAAKGRPLASVQIGFDAQQVVLLGESKGSSHRDKRDIEGNSPSFLTGGSDPYSFVVT